MHPEVTSNDDNGAVPVTRLYKRRWLILLIFGLFTSTQAGVYNTWGPVTVSAECVFSWNVGYIALMAAWGAIFYVLGCHLFVWFMDTKGIRPALLVSQLLVVIGCGLRCISSQKEVAFWLIQVGQILNGLAGPVACFAFVALSAYWFAPHERSTATALGNGANVFGMAIPFLLGPFVVTQRPCTTTENIAQQRNDVMLLMYIEAGWAAFIFVLMIIYFPSRPPLPPTPSASVVRFGFISGCKRVSKSKTFWLFCIPYSLGSAMLNNFISLLEPVVKPLGVNEVESGYAGFYAILGGFAGNIIVGRLADCFTKHLKLMLIVIWIIGLAFCYWLTMLISGMIQFSYFQFYLSTICFTAAIYASSPLLFEMCCESMYPVSETVVVGMMTFVYNVIAVPPLILPVIPSIGYGWMMWAILASLAFCLLPIVLVKERFRRLHIDEPDNFEDTPDDEQSLVQSDPSETTNLSNSCQSQLPGDRSVCSINT